MEYSLAYLMMRLVVACSMLGHGVVRLPKLPTFSQWMVQSYENTILPVYLVRTFGYVLPLAEFSIGVLLFIGLFSKHVLAVAGLMMCMLVLGTCLLESWEWLPSQLIHALIFAILLMFTDYDRYSLDNWVYRR